MTTILMSRAITIREAGYTLAHTSYGRDKRNDDDEDEMYRCSV